jgi:hypothetical protein
MSPVREYDGLNLPQLLDLMHGLAMPDPVSWMPQTPGWWVLLAWLLGVAVIGGWRIGSYRRRNRYRRVALRVLAAIESQTDHRHPGTAGQIAALLKRTALVAYPRGQVASLYGADWAEFLRQSANDDALVVAAADTLAMAAYRTDVDGTALCGPARRWIQVHRA